MRHRFTLGIEEEFQTVDHRTGELHSSIHTILERGVHLFGDSIKQELLQSTVEIVTNICPDIKTAREEVSRNRYKLGQLVAEEGLVLISAGTHPSASWQEQKVTDNQRYHEMVEDLRDAARSALIFGLHIHVGVENKEIAFQLMNQLCNWLPELLALSSNSPISSGRNTGYKSYRHVIWRLLPHSGIPMIFPSLKDHDLYVSSLIENRCISDPKKIWWDIRIHPVFDTIEFRVYDMPSTIDDTIALAALCQALVTKLTWQNAHGIYTKPIPRCQIEENKWRAMRDGLEAVVVDFEHNRSFGIDESIIKLLDFVEDVIDDLGSRREIDHIRKLLSEGTGADRQLRVYEKNNGNVQAVVRFLMEQTKNGIPLDTV